MYVAGGNNFFYLSIVALFFSYIVYVSKLMLVFVYVYIHSVCLPVQTHVYSYNEMNIPGVFLFSSVRLGMPQVHRREISNCGSRYFKRLFAKVERERFGGFFFLPSTKAS